MLVNNLPQFGDVITSMKFAFGYYNGESKEFIKVNGMTRKYPFKFRLSEDERVTIAAETGQIPPKERIVELGAYDESRGEAEFVVERANMTGGQSGQEYYPDGWYVVARRLGINRVYDPDGEQICFFMTGHFDYKVGPGDVHIVGKMEKQERFV
ncbi:MAG: hypothetical protein HGA31_06115 [Candidatus Moranbacteria bacterium]|nr:hypothetical protein [Candidatus Moranbacteria bacterium]